MEWIHLLVCPVCGSRLAHEEHALKCEQRHTFDMAREGYVNLLLKKVTGDTKEMLVARRNFLERGLYRPLSDAVNGLVVSHLHKKDFSPMTMLDAGCGEGYYLGSLLELLAERNAEREHCAIGIDVAKDAVRMAAKRYKEAFFAVANLKERLILADETMHVLLNIFAPRNPGEFARVLAPGGMLIIVIPGPAHLQELRSTLHLLNIEENKQQHVTEQFSEAFALEQELPVRYEMHLRNEEVTQAVMMTPNYWHLSPVERKTIEEKQEMKTQVEFICLLFRKR